MLVAHPPALLKEKISCFHVTDILWVSPPLALTFPNSSYQCFPLCLLGHSCLTSGKTLFTAALLSQTPQWLTSNHTVIYFSHLLDHCDSAWFSPK